MEGTYWGQWKRSYALVGADLQLNIYVQGFTDRDWYFFSAQCILDLLLLLLMLSVATAIDGRNQSHALYPLV